MLNSAVLVLTGIMASGKSTVADLLARRLPRAAHVRGDVFRRMIVSGRVKTGYGDWTVAQLDTSLRTETPRIGLWLDTSDQAPDQTVDEILDRLSESRV